MQVIDGQLVQHILEDANGFLNLNFNTGISDGFNNFNLVLNNQQYSFSNQFQGEDLIYSGENDELTMGSGVERITYKVILCTKRDLVLEYYDVPNFQLRKFIFVKAE